VTAVWSAVMSVIAFVIVDRLVGMRVAIDVERGGLDLAEHHEQAYEIV
jgi:Amt family ammonium transporter